jgi:hypothetical protein
LGRRNASAITKGEIPERNKRAFSVGHAKTKTETRDFKTLNPKMGDYSVSKDLSKGLWGHKMAGKRAIIFG